MKEIRLQEVPSKGPGGGCASRGTGTWLLVMAALFFAVMAAIFLAASLALLWLAPGRDGAPLPPPPSALLIPVLILLALVLILLLVLLWCCCGGGGLRRGLRLLRELFSFLPQFRQIAGGIEDAAKALDAMASALRLARTPVDVTGGALLDAGDKVDVSVPTVEPVRRSISLGPNNSVSVVVGLQAGTPVSPFGDAKAKLRTAGWNLTGDDSLSARMEEVAAQCNNAAAGLRAVKGVLDALAPTP